MMYLPSEPSNVSLLASTIASKLFLSTQEGGRWLVFLFTISPDLVGMLHKAARAAIPK